MVEATVAGEAPDELVVTLSSSGARRYYHQDRQGSVYLTTAASGAVDQWLGYDAYREVRVHDTAGRPIPAGAIASTFGYHGPPHDFVLGLVDMRARTYRTGLGQFLSPDPIGLAGGASLFAFVDSAPLAFRDPSGLAKEYRNALGDTLLLAHGDAFLYVRDPAASHPGYGWKGPAYLQWKAQDGAWRALDPSSFARATQDALAWENDPCATGRQSWTPSRLTPSEPSPEPLPSPEPSPLPAPASPSSVAGTPTPASPSLASGGSAVGSSCLPK
jgi:RHS repeat-associated protein